MLDLGDDAEPQRAEVPLEGVAARLEASLLGGALGDALGAPVEFLDLATIRARFGRDGPDAFAPAYGRTGAITDDTQMTLFTAEGLIRAHARWCEKGICHTASVVRNAYLRWLATQGLAPAWMERGILDGWLLGQGFLHEQRAPGGTCVSGLQDRRLGSREERLNGSKGCGTVMRIAPVAAGGFAGLNVFAPACELAALTHGHPTGWLAAGVMAETLAALLRGEGLAPALASARKRLRADLLAGLEGAEVIRTVAQDLHRHLVLQLPGLVSADWERYPGW